jgi:aspartate racemase
MHVGLIGGIGPAATEFYYRGLTRAFAAANRKLELTICNAEVREMTRNMDAGDAKEQGRIFAELIARMKAAGARAAAVTSMGGHFCIDELEAISPLPLINAIPELNVQFAKMGVGAIGILGSRAVMQSKFYGGVTSVEIVAPEYSAVAAFDAHRLPTYNSIQSGDSAHAASPHSKTWRSSLAPRLSI